MGQGLIIKVITIIKVTVIMVIGAILIGCAAHLPANRDKIETGVKITRPAISSNIRTIALLLPLSGDLAATGKAIRNGFLAAYYSSNGNGDNRVVQHNSQYNQSTESHLDKPNINIKIIDTANKNIVDVYRETVIAGVDIVVGPLTKQEVEALAKTADAVPSAATALIAAKKSARKAATNFSEKTLPVPTLALNTLNDYQQHPVVNLYQFGLLPQDEAQQVAIKMLQDGYRNVAIVLPDTVWGHGVAAAFQSELLKYGGRVVATLDYTSQDDFDLKIQQFLQVDINELRRTKKPIYHRADISAIFLIAESNIGTQLAPLLRFYLGDHVPLYATSHIYGGFVRAAFDQDLNTVIFCDIPWAITNPAELEPSQLEIRNKVNALWPDSQKSNIRLYALGVDAYKLAVDLNKLFAMPQVGLVGATGRLTLDSYNHIYRQLKWTTFKHGIPQGL